MKKFVIAGLLLPLALGAAAPAAATDLLREGFDSIDSVTAAGWIITNQSAPVGVLSWFQGNDGVFTAHDGPDNSYLASNFNASTPGGELANWLITPTFSTASAGTVTFWIRGAAEPGFDDLFAYGFSNGSAATSDFVLSSPSIAQGGWNAVSVAFAAGGAGSTGRFAIAHVGPEPSSNYIGVDTFSITTPAVPEPATWGMMLFGFGMIGLGLRRRSAAHVTARVAFR